MEVRGWIDFPKGFIWGTATSAYQIEGGYNLDGKGPSIWDEFCTRKRAIKNRENGNIACDHYHRFEEDFSLMQSLGYPNYRFSIAWTRIQPEGTGKINSKGLEFYHRLLDSLLAKNITPFVTLFHWDLPLALEKKGGWYSRETAYNFAEFTEIVVREYKDKVKYWITLNEPWVVMIAGYVLGILAPGKIRPYQSLKVAHNLLLAHGLSVERIRSISQDLKVGLVNALSPVESVSLEKYSTATRRANALLNELWLDPIYKGRYPLELEKNIFSQNKKILIENDLKIISQKTDFLGINHYTRTIVKPLPLPLYNFRPVKPSYPGVKFTSMNWEIYPKGMYDILKLIQTNYGNPPVYITENGVAFYENLNSEGKLEDENRIQFLQAYLANVSHAIHEGANVLGYFVWSFMDNFEWAEGYEKTFGLVHVDHKNKTLKRTPKKSAYWYSDVIRNNGFQIN